MKLRSPFAQTLSHCVAMCACSNLSTCTTHESFSMPASPGYFAARPGPEGNVSAVRSGNVESRSTSGFFGIDMSA